MWRTLTKEERQAFVELIYCSKEQNSKAFRISTNDNLYAVRKDMDYYIHHIAKGHSTKLRIIFNKLEKESRLLRYLIRHPSVLKQWIQNRANARYQLYSVKKANPETLSGFGFESTPQGAEFWYKHYKNAEREPYEYK